MASVDHPKSGKKHTFNAGIEPPVTVGGTSGKSRSDSVGPTGGILAENSARREQRRSQHDDNMIQQALPNQKVKHG